MVEAELGKADGAESKEAIGAVKRLLVVDVPQWVGVSASTLSVGVLATSGSSDVAELGLAGAWLVHEEVLRLAEVALDLFTLRIIVPNRPPRPINIFRPRLNIVLRLHYVIPTPANQDFIRYA